MNILHTVHAYAPAVGGSELVVQRISEGLACRGHSVTVATGGKTRKSENLNGVRVERFPIQGNAAIGIQGPSADYISFLRRSGWDVMMNYAAQSWTTDLALPLLTKLQCSKILAPCGYSGLRWPVYRDYFEMLPKALRCYEAIVYHSATYQDAQFGRQHNLTQGVVIPNGADDLAKGPKKVYKVGRRTKVDAPLVVTVGTHTHLKGHAEVLETFRLVRARHPKANLVIAGARLPGIRQMARSCYPRCTLAALTSPAINLVDGADRTQVIETLRAGTVFIFGSRVECSPLVILEAMAIGLPWVATPVGNIPELGGGIVAEGSAGLAAATVRLLESEDLRRELGDEGRRQWEKRHRWPRVVDQYERLYESLRK